ncbi:PD-(D/E)XK motif protein [Luteibacter aegosomatis]|uniref:PD-(D/E)XK motif protein n=1 Tax=Luteibacter aegosomatis TaxID=2911537 RepID=UPI001FF98873|nr:PD-(D/E)XK motif protein [Luteibacter aegosomatis]UPG86387.1 PD-(D/E)XK motif protein [Luteibacter aegosomatis]
MNINFEVLRDELHNLAVPAGRARNVLWLTATLAVGRTSTGDYEIFILGEAIQASSALVRRHMRHSEWQPEEGGDPFFANRIVLPSAQHFAAVATLIATELLRAGVAGPYGAQSAFTDVEPIVEMAIRRGALTESEIIGLVGELTVLRQLVMGCSEQYEALLRAIDFWQGWQRQGGRDFRIGDYSIEVKTTQLGESIHQFTGLHQVEPGRLASGAIERLHIASLGLIASATVGESLPDVVESILTLLARSSAGPEVSEEFLRRVSLYGTAGFGYAHGAMSESSMYGTRYVHTFAPRLYRVDDPAMRLLKRESIAETFVQADGLSFTLHLPPHISAYNPAEHWDVALNAMAST